MAIILLVAIGLLCVLQVYLISFTKTSPTQKLRLGLGTLLCLFCLLAIAKVEFNMF